MLKERIRTLCKLKGISIPKLEIELGLSSGSISKWDKSCPKADNLARVADYFNVTVDYLLGRQTLEDIELTSACIDRMMLEQKVLDLYKSMPPEMQKAAIAQLEALAALNKK